MKSSKGESGWEVVGRLAQARRQRLGLKQEDLRDYGGPAVSTVGKFERAAQPSFPLRTQQQMEQALGWPRGTIEQVVEAVDVRGDWDAIGTDWEVDLVEQDVPDLSGTAEKGEQVRRAVELSDAELLSELTYRVRNYAAKAESASAPGMLPPNVAVLDELVRRGKNPGWLMDSTGLEVDELLPFLEEGRAPRDAVARRIERALGWAAGSLVYGQGENAHRGADEFVAQLRLAAG